MTDPGLKKGVAAGVIILIFWFFVTTVVTNFCPILLLVPEWFTYYVWSITVTTLLPMVYYMFKTLLRL